MGSPLEQFRSLLSEDTFVFIVFYRGHWCPFCMQYLKTFSSLVGQIEKAGGTPIAITSEEAIQLPATRQASGFQGTVIVDPENTIAKELKSRDIVEVAISEKKGYPHGMAQPAVVVMKPQERTVIHSWAIVPKMMNLGGAKDRPDLNQIWENTQASLNGKPVVHKDFALQSVGTVLWSKIRG